VYVLRLPKDPPKYPTDPFSNGASLSATVWNFQQRPAFWFGMALCDTQSFPLATNVCTPDSDSNIFDNSDPTAPDYIGKHPGTAFMEFQFYPPGWIGTSCDNIHWCMAMTIANGFAQINFNPTASTCTSTPYAFHPMYATSSEHTRVPWTAHSFNVGFSDEIGHFEYCDTTAGLFGSCTSSPVPGEPDADDT